MWIKSGARLKLARNCSQLIDVGSNCAGANASASPSALARAAALASALGEADAFAPAQLEPTSMSWEQFRASFNLAPDLIHMSGFFLASHPTPVQIGRASCRE